MRTIKEFNSHRRIPPCVNMWSVTFFLLLLLWHLSNANMGLPHRPGRPSGVDHINGGERRMNSNPIVSHATLILKYHASMLTLQNSVISCALWLPQVWYYGVKSVVVVRPMFYKLSLEHRYHHITLLRSITLFNGTNNILQIIPHIQSY